jgi:hypothetical protein
VVVGGLLPLGRQLEEICMLFFCRNIRDQLCDL